MGTPCEVTLRLPLSAVLGTPMLCRHWQQAKAELPDPGYVRGKTVQHITDHAHMFRLGWSYSSRALCGVPFYGDEVDTLQADPHADMRVCKSCASLSPH